MFPGSPVFSSGRGAPPVPHSPRPSCYSCPSAAASSSHIQAGINNFPNAHTAQEAGHRRPHAEYEFKREDIEWTRLNSSDSDADCLTLTDPSRGHAAMDDVCRLSPQSTRCSRPARARASKGVVMTPPESSLRNPRSSMSLVLHYGSVKLGSSSKPTTSSADLSPQLVPKSSPHLTLHDHAVEHAYRSQDSIRNWVTAVENKRLSSPDRTAPLLNSLHTHCDMHSEADISNSIRSQSTRLSIMRSSSSNSPLPNPDSAFPAPSSSSSDSVAEECIGDWQLLINGNSPLGPPLNSPASASSQMPTMGPAPALPLEPPLLDESICQSLLEHWSDAEGWKDGSGLEGEGSTLGSGRRIVMEDTYPRSATASSRRSGAGFPSIELPTMLERHNFSALMLQSFTLAPLEASELNDGGSSHNHDSDPGPTSALPHPNYVHEHNFVDNWSPPALRPSSSTSSLDLFNLDLFSPASEHPDGASIWDNPFGSSEDSSISPGYYSSSPFVGWSSASDTESKPVLLSMAYIPPTQLRTIPLYQPQPIRLIPPIPVHLLDDPSDDSSNPER